MFQDKSLELFYNIQYVPENSVLTGTVLLHFCMVSEQFYMCSLELHYLKNSPRKS